MDRLRAWAAKFDALSLRERLLILITLVVAVALPGFTYLIEPAQKEQLQLILKADKLKIELAEAQVDLQLIKAIKTEDPNKALQDEIKRLKLVLAQRGEELKQRTATLVPPDQMIDLLQQILARQPGIRLLEARKAAPQAINLATPGAEGTSSSTEVAQPLLYRHDLALQLEGGFFQIQGFLKALEGAESSLFWDSLDYQVDNYPKATLRLKLYTLSTTKEWLGV
ncbi:hypothetical protein DV711_14665 [Motiliproteus coralliicola]|uniref:MSHA biogenesis protein MshJ n=1 Tax=Motiliproteus coralliicola TaxID=2283196 RepID=A0A369WB25_9GAMM|nr:hypothetical protein [Motiliproteus coralliicola]RDE18857.1 hypothetical protein DV711_14665 [Motiliproteus coralliicola]